jgi:hypothetical protein
MPRFATAIATLTLLLSNPALARADVVLTWNEILVGTLAGQNPLVSARVAAITHTAMFEAANAVTGEYKAYLGTITAPPGASPEAAVVAAGHSVLVHFFPAAASALDAFRNQSLAEIPDGQSKTDGIDVGLTAAGAMIALRATDGAAPPQFFMPTSSNPGDWWLTPACSPAGGVFFHVQNITPFGVLSSSQFRADPPPQLTSKEYAKAYEEVRSVGADDSFTRPPDRADVAVFYNALFPVPLWSQVARQLAAVHPTNSLTANARAFALMTMAMMDGLITTLETKYHYLFWRPETAIRAGAVDGNAETEPDIDFAPFITTPCHPSYPSAHASISYAARRVVHEIWGNGGHSIVLTVPSLPHLSLWYSSLKQITDDIDDARVYGGIHFRFDQEAGARQGWGIGRYIHENYLRPWAP